jgi:uncharacterized protein (TIGR02246 family)
MTNSDHEREIRRLFSKYVAAAKASNAADLAALFADDGIRYPPNAPAAVGNATVRSWYQSVFDQFKVDLKSVEVIEIEAAGDWGFASGTFAITLRPKSGGEPIEDTGNWLTILKRQADGAWRIYRDMFNSEKPAANR